MKINIPEPVQYILDTLNKNNYKAYLCGGAVRDSLLNKKPKDYDMTTDALPEQVKILFDKTIDTGLEHGTVTILIDKVGYEVTTFRTDGSYSDNRHPDNVSFTDTLKEDLSRRDFTINAIAYNDSEGLIDYFNGQEDLKNKSIRCVGDSNKRFQEDALRMLRAVRFSAQLGFEIDRDTEYSIKDNINLLNKISKERIRDEFNKIIISNNCIHGIDILQNWRFMKIICPEIYSTIFFKQYNPYHIYDVYEHILKSMEIIKPDLILRLTMFFHDLGKPQCFTMDENKCGHFYKHGDMSTEIVIKTMVKLKYDNDTIDKVSKLVKYHDYRVEVKKSSIKKFINRIGDENFDYWCQVRIADILAQNLIYAVGRLEKVFKIKQLYSEILNDKECFSLKDLAITGYDLMNEGIKEGKKIGKMLNILLKHVIESPDDNVKDKLLQIVKDEK